MIMEATSATLAMLTDARQHPVFSEHKGLPGRNPGVSGFAGTSTKLMRTCYIVSRLPAPVQSMGDRGHRLGPAWSGWVCQTARRSIFRESRST
jgi:hypothetical protein